MSLRASHLTLQASGAQTASGQGAAVEVGEYNQTLVTLNVTAASGTTPTLNAKLQASDDGGTTWYDLPSAAFTQLTGVGTAVLQLTETNAFGDYIRVAYTIAGTSPSFTFAVKAVAKG